VLRLRILLNPYPFPEDNANQMPGSIFHFCGCQFDVDAERAVSLTVLHGLMKSSRGRFRFILISKTIISTKKLTPPFVDAFCHERMSPLSPSPRNRFFWNYIRRLTHHNMNCRSQMAAALAGCFGVGIPVANHRITVRYFYRLFRSRAFQLRAFQLKSIANERESLWPTLRLPGDHF
jgi:hypothetical protein